MTSVQIIVNNVIYTLEKQVNGEWTITNNEPYIENKYPIEVIVTTGDAQITDVELAKTLALIISGGITPSGERMLNYYPQIVQRILEFQAITNSEGFEVEFLKNNIKVLVNEAYLTTMTEERIASWEKALGMCYSSDDTLQDRRDAVIARIRGQGKLNTSLINAIVNAFTGGTAISYIENSTLHVNITPPPTNKQYKFENVRRELAQKVPAHLGLEVTRNYSTWEDVKNNFSNWNDVKQLNSWEDLLLLVTT